MFTSTHITLIILDCYPEEYVFINGLVRNFNNRNYCKKKKKEAYGISDLAVTCNFYNVLQSLRYTKVSAIKSIPEKKK